MKIKTPEELFNYFKGNWSIKRTLEFFGECYGRAIFASKDQSLNYSEEVQIDRQGFGPKASKQYKFELISDSLNKKSEDGSLLCTLKIDNNEAKGEYRCKNDTYNVTYKINGQNSFCMTYQVVTGLGDKKYADIVTEFTREADLEAPALGVVEHC